MIDSVVGLVEENASSGGSRFSESVLESLHSAKFEVHVLLNSFTS